MKVSTIGLPSDGQRPPPPPIPRPGGPAWGGVLAFSLLAAVQARADAPILDIGTGNEHLPWPAPPKIRSLHLGRRLRQVGQPYPRKDPACGAALGHSLPGPAADRGQARPCKKNSCSRFAGARWRLNKPKTVGAALWERPWPRWGASPDTAADRGRARSHRTDRVMVGLTAPLHRGRYGVKVRFKHICV